METISLRGSWVLKCNQEATSSYFQNNSSLEYNNTNSVYTALGSVLSFEELKTLRAKLFSIERKFNIEIKEREHACLSAPGAKECFINGIKTEEGDITPLLKSGENEIKLIVNSSFFGNVEIYKSTEGVGYSAVLRAKKGEGSWIVSCEMDYEAFVSHDALVTLTLLGESIKQTISFIPGRRKYTVSLSIPEKKIELWSIHGDGKQILYTASIDIANAHLERNIAFREIEERDGALFVNGRETFLMGAIWPVELTSEQKRYDMMLNSAAWANMNTLFITEGHESHEFYNTCDRLGIIVMHDEAEDPAYTFHPSYVTGSIKADVFKAEVNDESYYTSCLDAIALERWTLKTRSDNANHGVIYDSLLSSVKEDGKWRPSHYAARRFFSDLVPIMFVENEKLYIYVSNDGAKEEDVELSIKFMTYSGQKRQKRMFSTLVPPHTAQKVQEIDLRNINRKNEFVYIKLRTFEIHRELTLLLDDIALCEYEIPEFEIKTRKINSKSYAIRVISNKPAFAVHLELDGIDGNFSDSFFEVRPSSEKSVIFNSAQDISEEELKSKLKVYDLASSLKR